MTEAPANPGIPFVKNFDFAYGRADRETRLVRRVVANNPGPFTYTGTGTYLVGDSDVAVIDPGPDDPAHLDAIMAAVGDGKVSHIVVTHTHLDHSEAAPALRRLTGAPVVAFGGARKSVGDAPLSAPDAGDDAVNMEEGVDDGFAPDISLTDGDQITGAGWTLEALHTPGHIDDHLCFALLEEKALFTGDHVMGWATTVIIPPEGKMGDYFNSLDRLIARDDVVYYPTHGAPIHEPQRFARAVKTHRRMRDAQILDRLGNGPRTIKALVEDMYADVDPRLHGAAAMSVLAHLRRLVETGEAGADGAPDLGATYRIGAARE